MNVLVAVLITLFIGLLSMRGVYIYSLQNRVDKLSVNANEASVLISQSIRSTQVVGDNYDFYASNAAVFADELSRLYSVDAMMFNLDMDVVGSTLADMDYTPYKIYAGKVYAANAQAYVITTFESQDYIIFFSPVTVNNEVIGVCALFESIAQIKSLMHKMLGLFLYLGAGAGVVSAVLYIWWYSKNLKPINQLVNYMKRATVQPDTPLEFTYKQNDEIKVLIDSCITMVNRINEKIEESNYEKEKLEAVISSMQDGVITLNAEKQVVTVNKRISEFFPNETDYFSIIPSFYDLVDKVSETSGSVSVEFAHGGKYYMLTGSPIGEKEQAAGILLVISDITTVKKIEDDQNKFISSVSHELRTPLTTIIGYIDLLQRRGVSDEAITQKALDTTKAEAQRLLRLVNDILNINRYNNIDFEFIFTNIDPNALIENVVAELNMKGNPNGIAILYTSVELPEIMGDYDRLKQVLINVIDNAVKYSNEDDIVRVTATYDENYLEITVRDFGEGIPEDKQEKVFETFYRVEEDRNRQRGGFGIGLSIVKNIIRKHSGKVKIESVAGQGTLVSIMLPLIKKKEVHEDEHEEDEQA
jgi:signal transduction histidine kinase